MSAVVEDISDTFTNIVRNFGTVLGLSIGIAVFAYAAPYMLQATEIVKGVLPRR